MRTLSSKAAQEFDEPVDFLFIDANHRYEAVKLDWANWFSKMNHQGIIALHDCKLGGNSPAYLGSMKFYEQDILQFANVTGLDSVDS